MWNGPGGGPIPDAAGGFIPALIAMYAAGGTGPAWNGAA